MPELQTVLLPTGASATAVMSPAQRPKTLKGLRVGVIDNGKEFSDQVLEALGEALRRDHGVTTIKFWRKGFPAKGAPFIDEMAAETDVAISGVGHCGSSTPWSVIDAVNLEKAGVPSVALVSRSFCPLGTPAFSRLTASITLHSVEEPQCPTPLMATSVCAAISSMKGAPLAGKPLRQNLMVVTP